jgi:hypothetical protein
MELRVNGEEVAEAEVMKKCIGGNMILCIMYVIAMIFVLFNDLERTIKVIMVCCMTLAYLIGTVAVSSSLVLPVEGIALQSLMIAKGGGLQQYSIDIIKNIMLFLFSTVTMFTSAVSIIVYQENTTQDLEGIRENLPPILGKSEIVAWKRI